MNPNYNPFPLSFRDLLGHDPLAHAALVTCLYTVFAHLKEIRAETNSNAQAALKAEEITRNAFGALQINQVRIIAKALELDTFDFIFTIQRIILAVAIDQPEAAYNYLRWESENFI